MISIQGKAIVRGILEGEALVSKTPFSFFLGVNTDTGEIIEEGHELQGKNIAGKILVYPHGKGSSGDCLRLWRCANNGVAPLAIINSELEPVHVQGAIIANIPMVSYIGQEQLANIHTGDRVCIEGSRVTIL